MSYFALQNFKGGLDTRRSELSAVAGSLITAENGHINEGGEFEKRLAWVSLGSLPAGTGYTFGFETVSSGAIVFGSATSASVTPLPTNTVYQRLQHPCVAESAAALAMTAILCSTSYGGNAWAVAKFSDNSIFGYYNGTFIPAFRNGVALTGLLTNTNIATYLSTVVDAVTGFYVTGVSSSGSARYFDMYCDVGINYQPSASIKTSAAGTITAVQRTQQTIGTAEISPTGAIGIFAGVTGTITGITVNNVEILGSTVTFTTDVNTTAQVVANTINNFISSPEYIATYVGNIITIHATSGSGATANGYVIKVTSTGDMIVDNTFFTLPAGAGNACQFVKINGATDILGSTVTQTSTVAVWATAIATAINAFQATYNACAVSGSVFISKKVRASNDTFETSLSVSLTTGAVTGNTSSTGTAPPPPTTLVVQAFPTVSTATISTSSGVSGVLHCTVSGGITPYVYTWKIVGILSNITPTPTVIANQFGSDCTVSISGLSGANGADKNTQVSVSCQVIDSSPAQNVVVSNIIVVDFLTSTP